jgi:4-amino-4-deoxy-L-arabinose transferase-like glycosyltransferase
LPDQREYLTIAQNLRAHGSLSFFDPRFDQTVFGYRLPGYPAFLAGLGTSVRVVRVAQALLDLSTITAVFLIARRLLGSVETALIAAAIIAINPFFVYFSTLILSETLFAALVIWGIFALVVRRWVLAAVFLLSACMVRPTGLLLMPALVVVASLNPGGGRAYRLSNAIRRASVALVMSLVLMGLVMMPWAWRNHHRLGVFLWSTTNDGITAYDGFHPGATGASDQRFVTDFPQVRSMNEVMRSDFFRTQATHWIDSHWAELPALTFRKIFRGWSPVPLSQDFGKPAYRLISVSYELPLDLLCLAGLFSPRLSRQAKWLLITPALVVTLGQAMTVGSIRYRMPAEAPMAVLAAAGASSTKFRMTKPGFGHLNFAHA